MERTICAIDIGTGTQDVLIYTLGTDVENSVQLVLPSPTRVLAGLVRQATRDGVPVDLQGTLMGGGPLVRALGAHLDRGLQVTATPEAALTIHDNPDRVRQMGIEIGVSALPGARVIRLADLDPARLGPALDLLGVLWPERFLVAALDHGHSPLESNRRFRFRLWERFLADGGRLGSLLNRGLPPAQFTRLRAISSTIPGTATMDSGAAALWGILQDPVVHSAYRRDGVVAVNIGNSHTLAALLREGRVWGLFEHHTARMDSGHLEGLVASLREGALSFSEVFEQGGHGAALDPGYERQGGYNMVAVTGPRRGLVSGCGWHMAVPWGNMMLSGCFGLLAAAGYLADPGGEDEDLVPDSP